MTAAGRRTALVLGVLTILVCVVALAGSEPITEGLAPPPAPELQQDTEPPRETPQEAPVVPQFESPEVEETPPDADAPDWLRVAGLVVLVLALLLLARELWRLHRAGWRRVRVPRAVVEEEPEEDDEPEEGADVARRAVDAALVPLREPRDAREAVIEAYARMERVLAERALARRTPEAPREYLDRVLLEQGMPERSLTTLTALFEEARFSLHPVPDSAPEQAREELERARAALGGQTPSSARGGLTPDVATGV